MTLNKSNSLTQSMTHSKALTSLNQQKLKARKLQKLPPLFPLSVLSSLLEDGTGGSCGSKKGHPVTAVTFRLQYLTPSTRVLVPGTEHTTPHIYVCKGSSRELQSQLSCSFLYYVSWLTKHRKA